YGQRLVRGERNVAADALPSTGRSLFEKALRGGAAALAQPVGALAPGRRADFLVLDPDHPVLAGRAGDELLDAWIFAGNASPLREVWVGGSRVVAEGRHPAREVVADGYRRALRRILG